MNPDAKAPATIPSIPKASTAGAQEGAGRTIVSVGSGIFGCPESSVNRSGGQVEGCEEEGQREQRRNPGPGHEAGGDQLLGGLSVHWDFLSGDRVDSHRDEQERQVGEREQVGPQGKPVPGLSFEQGGKDDEGDAKGERRSQVEAA